MFGLTNHVIVIVINEVLTDTSQDNSPIEVKARCLLRTGTIGNQQAKSRIQKQAFNPKSVPDVRTAYGITGTDWATHSAYKNGLLIGLNDSVRRNDQIVLIRNDIDPEVGFRLANQFALLPERTCR